MTSNLNSDNERAFKQFKEKMKRADNYSEGSVIAELDRKAKVGGWKTEIHPDNEPGIDLKAQKGNQVIIIEAKGERRDQTNATGRVLAALGQIMMDMEEGSPDKEYCYCIAFPGTEGFKKVARRIPATPRRRLNINIIFIDCVAGSLKLLRPNASYEVDLTSLDGLLQSSCSS